MLHQAYPKIPTAERAGGTAAGGTWVATEKVHGAQLVVACDGSQVRIGKRKAWLEPDEPFFGWQLLRPSLAAAGWAAWERFGVEIHLYGELYGGHYPHPQVRPVPGTSPVQTGIWYGPEIRYALFDLLRADQSGGWTFGTYAEVAAVAAAGGVDAVPLLRTGPRVALDTLPVRFPTRLPHLLGLPDLAGNLAEGLVLRPDSALAPQRRPIVKFKIEEFDEQRYNLSQPWDAQVILGTDRLVELGTAMVNAPRLASARSKVGPSAPGQLIDEVLLDVLVDLAAAYPAAMAVLTEQDETTLSAAIRAAAQAQPSSAA